LDWYSAPPNTEAAFLFAGPYCSITRFSEDFLGNSSWWQEVKYLHFEQSLSEICLVTDAWTTNRWAFEYRSAGLQDGANYVLNSKQDGYHDTRISDFQLLHNSKSQVAQVVPMGNIEHFTVLCRRISVQKYKLGCAGGWVLRFQKYNSKLTIIQADT
jgi:hypothetical protein